MTSDMFSFAIRDDTAGLSLMMPSLLPLTYSYA